MVSPFKNSKKTLDDVRGASKIVDVSIITGDTKVIEANVGVVINTSGIGTRCEVLEKNLKILNEYRKYTYKWVRDKGFEERRCDNH